MSYRPPWASPGELPSCWAADEDDSPSCGRLLCKSCPSPTCCSRRHPYWPNWWEIKMNLEETNDKWLTCLTLKCIFSVRTLIQLLQLPLCTVYCLLSVYIIEFVSRLGCATVCTVSEDKSPHRTEIIQSITSQVTSYKQKRLYFLLVTAVLWVLVGLDHHPLKNLWLGDRHENLGIHKDRQNGYRGSHLPQTSDDNIAKTACSTWILCWLSIV